LSPSTAEPAAARAAPEPLSAGPLPLSRLAAWLWALVILASTLFLGYGLTAIAARVAEVTVPPGSITFGSASILPAPGWSLTDRTATSVTLDNNGVWVRFRSVSAQGSSAAARALDLAEDMTSNYPSLTVASKPYSFATPTAAQGQLIALSGANRTSVVAAVVEGDQAVDVQSLGESTLFGAAIADIEAMIESIRIREPDGG
jgi:hypothetical protein